MKAACFVGFAPKELDQQRAGRALDVDNAFPRAYTEMTLALLATGDAPAALETIREAEDRGGENARTVALRGFARAVSADRAAAESSLMELALFEGECFVGALERAILYLGLGENKTDYNGDIKPGPLELGFDYAFIIPATGDRVPCVFVENHRVVGYDPADPIQVSYGAKIGDEPTGKDPGVKLKIQPGPGHFDTVVNGISRIGFMTGGKAARWVDEDMR